MAVVSLLTFSDGRDFVARDIDSFGVEEIGQREIVRPATTADQGRGGGR